MRDDWQYAYDCADYVPALCYTRHCDVYLQIVPGASWGSLKLAKLKFKLCENSFRCIERYFGDQ